MSKVEYLTFESTNYFSRSWKMLTRDKGWIKPVLLLTVGALVPVLGMLCVMGYVLEWARLTAWGVNTAPKQTNVQLGDCLATGWRAFVVSLVYGIIYGLANMAASIAFTFIPFINVLWAVANPLCGLIFGVLLTVAMIRSAIYQRIGAGLAIGEVFNMIKSDFNGIVRLCGLTLVISLVVGLIATIVFGFAFILVFGSSVPSLIELSSLANSGAIDSTTYSAVAPIIAQLIRNGIPAAVICGIIVSFFGTISHLVLTNAVGLWMIQFDVASWGNEGQTSKPAQQAAPVRPADVPEQDEVVVETVIPVTPAAPAAETAPEASVEPAEAPAEAPVAEPAESDEVAAEEAPAETSAAAPAEESVVTPSDESSTSENAAAEDDKPAE